MRFSNVILAYLVIGGVMFAGGAISFSEAGVNQFFVEYNSGDISASGESEGVLGGLGNAITEAAALAGGVIILIWNLITGLFTYLNWPVTVLLSVNAPTRVVLLMGVPLNAAFYLAVIRLLRSSA